MLNSTEAQNSFMIAEVYLGGYVDVLLAIKGIKIVMFEDQFLLRHMFINSNQVKVDLMLDLDTANINLGLLSVPY